jgi:ribonuclease HI
MFYRAIRELKKFPERIKTTIMLDLTRYAVRAQCNIVPTDEMIWRSIRNKDISRNIRDFLWRCLHDSYKCGVYWWNIPGFEQFATYHFCGADENVEHVLVECADDLARISIWDLCTQLWENETSENACPEHWLASWQCFVRIQEYTCVSNGLWVG